MTNPPPSSIMRGAMILTLAGLLGKILSAGYRVPLQNITGDLGFYIYQQVYPILGVALILALYGFPAAVSKLTSEENQSSLLMVLFVLFFICGGVFAFGYSQSERIAAIMGDPKLAPSLQGAFFIFLFAPLLSVFRGVFQGKGYMVPTAVSQMIEQVIRVVGILLAAWVATSTGDLYEIGKGAAIASCAAALGALGVLVGFWKRNPRVFQWNWTYSILYVKTILIYGLLISLNYTLLLSLQAVDALTLVSGLMEAGFTSDEARVAKGVFDRGQPLLQLGVVVASSMSLALIPNVTRTRWTEQPKRMREAVMSAIKFSFVIALAATVGLILLFPTLNPLFFLDEKGTEALQLLMLVILMGSLAMTTASVLQGLDHLLMTALLILGGAVTKGLCNLWLVPVLGLSGAALSSVIAVTFVLIGNIVILGQEMPITTWRTLPWKQIGLSLFFMTAVVWGLSLASPLFDQNRLLLLGFTLATVGVGALAYLVSLLKLGAFEKREIEELPLSKWWLRLLPKGLK